MYWYHGEKSFVLVNCLPFSCKGFVGKRMFLLMRLIPFSCVPGCVLTRLLRK